LVWNKGVDVIGWSRFGELKRQVTYVTSRLLDGFRGKTGAGNLRIPPNAEKMVGGGDFHQVGNEFKRHFIELAGLMPCHFILDVGSGIGRMALPLTMYLNSQGEYHGIDIVSKGVRWCNRNISSRYANFHFHHIDVKNGHYSKKGSVRAEDFVFPFKDCYFDHVVLISVFTHMLPKEVDNYFLEIARVLKPGGRCFCTAFLLNDESRQLVDGGASTQKFRLGSHETAVVFDKDPEASIAYDERHFIRAAQNCGLELLSPVHYGSWCGRTSFLSYQDILIFERKN